MVAPSVDAKMSLPPESNTLANERVAPWPQTAPAMTSRDVENLSSPAQEEVKDDEKNLPLMRVPAVPTDSDRSKTMHKSESRTEVGEMATSSKYLGKNDIDEVATTSWRKSRSYRLSAPKLSVLPRWNNCSPFRPISASLRTT